jgi:uncharacterized protein (TIGR03000 family)
MYSIVLMAAMTATPDMPQDLLCPVSPSRYTGGILSHSFNKHCFYDCCAPARYGWVNCHTKGFGFYPLGACGPCAQRSGPLWHGVGSCEIYGGCGYGGSGGCATGCSNGCGIKGWSIGGSWGCSNHNWHGLDWGIGKKPHYWPSPGCYPGGYAPYARSAPATSCGCYGGYTFDSGLIGHSHGVGYAGFGATGNFGMYGQVPMQHPPTLADVPSYVPQVVDPMMVAPAIRTPAYSIPGTSAPQLNPNIGVPESLIPPPPANLAPPMIPTPAPLKDAPKKDIPKSPVSMPKGEPATVLLTVPAGAKVFINGYALKSDAAERTFRTPAIPFGENYSYTVKAIVAINGVDVVEEKTVQVSAGSSSTEQFSDLIAKVERANVKLAGK